MPFLFLMNDCGTVLHKSDEFAKLSFPDFWDRYKSLWQTAVSMSGHFLHGDALSHNMVYDTDSQELVLIDLDEGTFGTKAAKRVVRLDDGDKYPFLRYPNYLRAWQNREQYTQLQLAFTFLSVTQDLFFAGGENAAVVSSDQRTLITQMDALAAASNTFLARHNDADPGGAQGMNSNVNRLIGLMKDILDS